MAEILAQLPYMTKEQQDQVLAGPALLPPDNTTIPNFENPPNNNELAVGMLSFLLVLGCFAFLSRMFIKATVLRKLRWEDGIIFVAFGFYVGFAYNNYAMLDIGFWIHQWDMTLRTLQDFRWRVHIGSVLYSIANPLIKIGILMEWTHIFVPTGTRNAFWWTCTILMISMACFLIAGTLSVFFECVPYKAIWDFRVAEPKCIDVTALQVASAAVHFAYDLTILVIPQKVIWGLKMSIKKKIGVSFVFSIGIAACVAALVRLIFNIGFGTNDDATYALGNVAIASFAEMTCGLLVFGIPMLPKAFRDTKFGSKIRSGFRSMTGRSTMGASHNSTAHLRSNRSINHQKSQPDHYQKLDDRGVPMTNMSSATATAKKASFSSESTERLHGMPAEPQQLRSNNILRTTKISSTEEHNPHHAHHHQNMAGSYGSEHGPHPWDVHGRV